MVGFKMPSSTISLKIPGPVRMLLESGLAKYRNRYEQDCGFGKEICDICKKDGEGTHLYQESISVAFKCKECDPKTYNRLRNRSYRGF